MNQHQNAEPEPYTLTDALDNVEITMTDGGALTSIRRAELDRQGDTARKYNRSISGFRRRLHEYVTYNEDVATSCIYSLPRGGKNIQGPTVRFAELVLQAWGNMDSSVTLIGVDKDAAVLEGRCTDYETNVSQALVARRRVLCRDKKNERKLDDAKQLAVASGTAIAKRNAILSVVPKVFWQEALHAAADASTGEGTLEQRRTRALDWFTANGATADQVYVACEVEGFDDLGMNELRYLSGIRSSIKLKTVKMADALRPPEKEKPRGPARTKPSSLASRHDPETGEVPPGK